MQIVCDSCGHSGAASSVDVVDGQVVVGCSACGAKHALAATASAPAGPAATTPAAAAPLPAPEPVRAAAHTEPPDSRLPPVKCPKCGSRQYDERACHKCGLVFAKVRGGRRPWERVPPEKAGAVKQARDLWERIEANPADAAAHGAFVEFAKKRGISDFAAMRYRHWVADHPDDALAQSYLQQSVRDAHAVAQALISARTSPDGFQDSVKRARTGILVVVTLLTVALFVLVLRVFASGASY